MLQDPLDEGNSDSLVLELHVVVLLVEHVFAQLAVTSHAQHEVFDHQGYLILDHREVVLMDPDVVQKHSLKDLDAALNAQLFHGLDLFGQDIAHVRGLRFGKFLCELWKAEAEVFGDIFLQVNGQTVGVCYK